MQGLQHGGVEVGAVGQSHGVGLADEAQQLIFEVAQVGVADVGQGAVLGLGQIGVVLDVSEHSTVNSEQ